MVTLTSRDTACNFELLSYGNTLTFGNQYLQNRILSIQLISELNLNWHIHVEQNKIIQCTLPVCSSYLLASCYSVCRDNILLYAIFNKIILTFLGKQDLINDNIQYGTIFSIILCINNTDQYEMLPLFGKMALIKIMHTMVQKFSIA